MTREDMIKWIRKICKAISKVLERSHRGSGYAFEHKDNFEQFMR